MSGHFGHDAYFVVQMGREVLRKRVHYLAECLAVVARGVECGEVVSVGGEAGQERFYTS